MVTFKHDRRMVGSSLVSSAVEGLSMINRPYSKEGHDADLFSRTVQQVG